MNLVGGHPILNSRLNIASNQQKWHFFLIAYLKLYKLFKSSIRLIFTIKEDSVLAAHDKVGIKLITRLRIGFSHLNNHKFRQNFKDAINPLCSCGKAIESAIHYYCKTSTIPCRERNSFMFLEPTLKISMTRKSLNSSFFIIFLEVVTQRCSAKKVVLTIL